jgi:transcriptional regulator GlxA family with amidase domain
VLAHHVHVSVRALQEGLRRSLDTTPMRYLREVRLRKVHEELLAATSDVTTVGAIVYGWGILNQGRFAGSYRAKFGETPADTLRRRWAA